MKFYSVKPAIEEPMGRERIEGTAWFKTLIRHFGIFRGDPTSQELELLAEIQGRVSLVVKARWILLLLLAIYGAYAGGFIFLSGDGAELGSGQMVVLGVAVAVVVACNLFYQDCPDAVQAALKRREIAVDEMSSLDELVHFLAPLGAEAIEKIAERLDEKRRKESS